ncbi:hypothetical protein [Polyangium sp. 15x6]|uniref:hypothetical protein n=1 Tax=Polyangium sp. 15x6 TaxID=3042687 RepID=UPI00249B1BA2|nr:hypothetical protein [Polyangium sp. 15x6]MDI3290984.1 hypothetical protein [Polyangium sp. 15x6]
MERLKGPDLARLRSQVSGFSSSNHFRYLSEALQTTRASNDPVEALALLKAMWGTAYAKTPDEKNSLNDVGLWLERRLRETPGVDAQRIALELAWARRIARIAEAQASAERKGAERDGHGDRKHGGPPDRSRKEVLFGAQIEVISRRRAEVLAARPAGIAPMPATSGTPATNQPSAAQRRLDELVANYKGPQNARQIFESIMAIAADTALQDDVRQALAKLLAKDRKFWKNWVKDKAKPEERAFAVRFGMIEGTP